MRHVRYSPGEATTVVTRTGVAVIAAELPATLVDRIWSRLDDGRGLAAVLEALTGAFGTSLTAIPPFAVALAEESSVRIAVRGQMSITVDGAAGSDTVSGAGVTTWSERVVDSVAKITVCSGSSATSPLDLPIRDGVVLAAEVTIDWTVTSDGDSADDQREIREPDRDGGEARPAVDDAEDGDESDAPQAAPRSERGPARSPRSRVAAVPPPPGTVEPPVASTGAVIDSSAVLSAITGDTLLPNESTFAPGLTAEPADEPADEPALADAEGESPWDATMLRPDDDTERVAQDDDPLTPDEAVTPLPGDHDGQTISLAEARAQRTGNTDSTPPPLAPPRPTAIGRLRLSTGQVVLLDRTVVIGRRPRSTRVTGTDLPHLIVVDSPQQDISRSHVEVRTEGDGILVTDLHTTNGTTLLRSGADPVRLHPGERTVVVAGDRIDLGDGVVVTVEDAP